VSSARRGMTLIELLLVLAILAMLAGLLVSSADGMMDRARLDETERRGQAVVEAVLGDGKEASRFMADMGRPPILLSTESGKQLSELWEPGANGRRYGQATTPAVPWPLEDTGVSGLPTSFTLDCGWRGPYLDIPGTQFFDGWPAGGWSLFLSPDLITKTLVHPNTDGSFPADHANKYILGFQSRGGDGKVGGDSWVNKDITYPHGDNDFGNRRSELTVLVYVRDENEPYSYVPAEAVGDSPGYDCLRAALIVPEMSGTTRAAIAHVREASSGHEIAFESDPSKPSDPPLFPGPRKLYVYAYKSGDKASLKSCGEPIPVDLKPGPNTVRVYLSKDL